MNIQIYGKSKCQASRAAERYYKERKIKYQFINLAEKGMSSREIDNVLASVKSIDMLIDSKSTLYVALNIANLRTVEAKKERLIANPMLTATPIVRDCDSRKCTVGGHILLQDS